MQTIRVPAAAHRCIISQARAHVTTSRLSVEKLEDVVVSPPQSSSVSGACSAVLKAIRRLHQVSTQARSGIPAIAFHIHHDQGRPVDVPSGFSFAKIRIRSGLLTAGPVSRAGQNLILCCDNQTPMAFLDMYSGINSTKADVRDCEDGYPDTGT
ncbi:hypothetical protein SISSUDRAFT_402415 [Sistotremastrum suecicum HHB10207 ss-3]|uniref:Uncharacterized protein n=1 Tax=Sistotremastrum suecicum HHB10207 ss-3 TaxID=1314776 RepID=A0A166FSP8_9AGAM|nr:hypothetical protein SISSUDRAFT_402415 [Sistotremastrum suecicum HHB10207 ss-3]